MDLHNLFMEMCVSMNMCSFIILEDPGGSWMNICNVCQSVVENIF